MLAFSSYRHGFLLIITIIIIILYCVYTQVDNLHATYVWCRWGTHHLHSTYLYDLVVKACSLARVAINIVANVAQVILEFDHAVYCANMTACEFHFSST